MLFIDLTVNGLITGVFYALMAIGLTLIFGILKIVNFAHGEFYMVGAYAYILLSTALGLSVWISLPVAIALGTVIGWTTERALMSPLYAGYSSWGLIKDEYAIIVTFGLSLLLINLVDKIIGPYPYRGLDLIEASRIEIGPVIANAHRLLATGLGIFVIGVVFWFMKYTFWGKQIQAVAQNRLGASLAGIDPKKVSSIVFSLSGGLAAFAGGLLAPMINASPDVGIFPAIKSYVVVVLGGMGSILGALLASLLLGVAESFAAVYLSYGYRDTFGLVVLILVLMFRPQGLFGEKVRSV
ncbi:MAG: branched-chain amino acid ABC transporter permease [Desulfobacterales bacterium]|jgi:branched-chain amino acid transport system permease protein